MKNKLIDNFINSFKNKRSFFGKSNQKKLLGFSLIESLISISILLIIISLVLTVFFASIQSQRKVLASQELLNSVAHVIEYMSRAIRMAKKEVEEPLFCLSERGLNFELTRGGKGLRFINHRDECQEFFLDLETNRLKQSKRQKNGVIEEQLFFLTPTDLEIVSWNFYLSGQCQEDNLQPRVTLSFKIKGEGADHGSRPEMKVQTTISQRSLDFKR